MVAHALAQPSLPLPCQLLLALLPVLQIRPLLQLPAATATATLPHRRQLRTAVISNQNRSERRDRLWGR